MLRVSIHAGPLAKISRSNRLDWLDIGYQRLAPAADYKVVLFKIGEGAAAGQPALELKRHIDTTYNTGLTVPATNSYTDQINPNLGTSFSAPIVSGIAALMRAVNANLTPPQLIARMKSSVARSPRAAGVDARRVISSSSR